MSWTEAIAVALETVEQYHDDDIERGLKDFIEELVEEAGFSLEALEMNQCRW